MPLAPSALEPLLRLALVPGIGPQRLALLIGRFGSAERALAASARELEILPTMSVELARRVREFGGPAGREPLRRALAAVQRSGAVAITPDDSAYPDAFRPLSEPPFLLFATGDLALLESGAVAMVGTRHPTQHGIAAAATLAAGVAAAGYAVVSGMARGIDSIAHASALDAGGTTIGVLGHGIDQVYPPENRTLFSRVRDGGLLISEFAPGERPKAGNFPRRNRLITALSRIVVVVEMGLKSGAQHSVTFALEQGRDVMTVPGPFGSAASMGSNQLLRDGARAVTCVDDVLEELEGVGARRAGLTPPQPAPRVVAPELPLLSPPEDRALRALSPQPRHVDEVGRESGLEPAALLPVLLELELRGMAESLPGMRFRRK